MKFEIENAGTILLISVVTYVVGVVLLWMAYL